jgi:Tol biopolymer transport system component
LLPFDARKGKITGEGQPATPVGMDVSMSELSSDGKKLVFVATRPGSEKPELWEKSVDEGHETLLLADDSFWLVPAPRWSPDRTRMAYTRVRYADPAHTQKVYSIVLLNAGGGNEQLLTSPLAEAMGATPSDWSPDGQWIIGSCDHGKTNHPVICLFPIAAAPRAESQMRIVLSDPEYNLWQGRFSPDGRWVSFSAVKAREAGISILGVMPASGGAWTSISQEEYWADEGRWSPDGNTIYFVSNRLSGFLNLWGVCFDPVHGKACGKAFQVTKFESPSRMILPDVESIDVTLSEHRLAVPILETRGSVWMLDNVDR